MKKSLFAVFLALTSAAVFAAEFESKGTIIAGTTPQEEVVNIKSGEKTKEFGGAYVAGDFILSNSKMTLGSKIYYRSQASSTQEETAQKIDIKKAYMKYRPYGNNSLEFALGKLYSYYLPGNFMQLAEVYTGSSRWGKTGAGVKAEYNGFTFGLGLPVTESYVTYEASFGLNGAVVYDFSKISDVPVKAGASVLYARTKTTDSKTKAVTEDEKYSETVSLYYTPKLTGFVSKLSLCLSGSFDSEPYVASSVFKNVANYSNTDLKECNFASLNMRSNFGSVQFILEGEAGHSTQGDMVPLYAGAQLLIPVTENISFKPRAFYYGALNTSDSDSSRENYEFYPRLWITSGQYVVSAGVDFNHMQLTKDNWEWEWSVPLFVEYKIGK